MRPRDLPAGWIRATRTYWTDKRQPTRAEGKRAAIDDAAVGTTTVRCAGLRGCWHEVEVPSSKLGTPGCPNCGEPMYPVTGPA